MKHLKEVLEKAEAMQAATKVARAVAEATQKKAEVDLLEGKKKYQAA